MESMMRSPVQLTTVLNGFSRRRGLSVGPGWCDYTLPPALLPPFPLPTPRFLVHDARDCAPGAVLDGMITPAESLTLITVSYLLWLKQFHGSE